MKPLILTALLSLNTSYACPSLGGKYHCTFPEGYADRPYDLDITQFEKDGITTYQIATSGEELGEYLPKDLIADGISRSFLEPQTEPGKNISGTFTTNCSETTVSIQFLFRSEDENFDLIVKYNARDNGNLQEISNKIIDGKETHLETINCTPRNTQDL